MGVKNSIKIVTTEAHIKLSIHQTVKILGMNITLLSAQIFPDIVSQVNLT